MVARLEHPDDEQVPVFEDNVLAALGSAELLALLPTVTGYRAINNCQTFSGGFFDFD